MRPDLRFLLAHPAHVIALSFGAGLSPRAAGTVGTLMAFPLYYALTAFLPPMAVALLAVPGFLLGIWACEVTARHMKVKDPNAICWDETICFLPLLALTHGDWLLQGMAFAAFRVFDIWKPYPIHLVDRHVQGGLGIMLDDAIAAMYAYVIMIVVILATTTQGTT